MQSYNEIRQNHYKEGGRLGFVDMERSVEIYFRWKKLQGKKQWAEFDSLFLSKCADIQSVWEGNTECSPVRGTAIGKKVLALVLLSFGTV